MGDPSFKPFISAEKKVPEFTFRAIALGMILGLIFSIGNAYLGLRIGTTISASIPAAVLSMAILRTFFRRVSILENNVVQTISAVGEGLAAGVIFTVPALFLLGSPLSNWKMFFLSLLGGILGILFMIPMRRYIVVKEHGKIPFPEGTACAEILKSGEEDRKGALLALIGIAIGSIHKILSSAVYLFNEAIRFTISPFVFSMDATPSLLGVGFIIGPRIALLMFAGGVIGWWIFIPLIQFFGQGEAVLFPATVPISAMNADDIWSNYIRYIGAGTVAIGGLVSFVRIIPLIANTFKEGFREMFHMKRSTQNLRRTDVDIPLTYLMIGLILSVIIIWLMPGFHFNFLTVVLLIILGFFFSAVTSITVGIVGSTSNPVSGMTITTLLITSFIFVFLGWTEKVYLIAAITMSCVANVAICLASTTSQDLKTGFLLGATPRTLQIAEMIGLFLPAITLGGTLSLLNKAYVFGSPSLPAPQAMLMSLIAKGVITGSLPKILVLVGIILGAIVGLMRISILPFALGLYLPLSLSTAVMIGGIVRIFIQKKGKSLGEGRGMLISSGLVAGDACTGVIIAFFILMKLISPEKKGLLGDPWAFCIYLLLAMILYGLSKKNKK